MLYQCHILCAPLITWYTNLVCHGLVDKKYLASAWSIYTIENKLPIPLLLYSNLIDITQYSKLYNKHKIKKN